jgi:hypothetical protein
MKELKTILHNRKNEAISNNHHWQSFNLKQQQTDKELKKLPL